MLLHDVSTNCVLLQDGTAVDFFPSTVGQLPLTQWGSTNVAGACAVTQAASELWQPRTCALTAAAHVCAVPYFIESECSAVP